MLVHGAYYIITDIRMSMPPLLPHILHTKIVTFVTLPATPRPVPSKKRQRFILCNSYRGGFAPLDFATLLRKAPRVVRLARLPHIGHAPACASFGSPSARFPPKGFRLSAVHLCTACSALRAIPSLRSAPLIDIAIGDSSLRSSGDISLRSAGMS